MAENIKPLLLNEVWAEAGDKVNPGTDKTRLGWIEEVPPHEWFNYLDNKRDAFIAHANQFGIPQWDNETQYIGLKSVTMGSDGVWYRCLITNVNQDPTTAVEGYWSVVPQSTDDPVSLKRYVGYQLYASNFTAEVNHRYYLTTPLTVTLPSDHTAGDTITLAKSPTITATITTADADMILTSLGQFDDATFDINDEINLVSNGTNWEV